MVGWLEFSAKLTKLLLARGITEKQARNTRVADSRCREERRRKGGDRCQSQCAVPINTSLRKKEVGAAPLGAVKVDPGPGPGEVSPDARPRADLRPTPGQPKASRVLRP